jgi:hypothetical protein
VKKALEGEPLRRTRYYIESARIDFFLNVVRSCAGFSANTSGHQNVFWPQYYQVGDELIGEWSFEAKGRVIVDFDSRYRCSGKHYERLYRMLSSWIILFFFRLPFSMRLYEIYWSAPSTPNGDSSTPRVKTETNRIRFFFHKIWQSSLRRRSRSLVSHVSISVLVSISQPLSSPSATNLWARDCRHHPYPYRKPTSMFINPSSYHTGDISKVLPQESLWTR